MAAYFTHNTLRGSRQFMEHRHNNYVLRLRDEFWFPSEKSADLSPR